jgi:hypothetical protein
MAIFAKTPAKIIMFVDDFPANEISQNFAKTYEISHYHKNWGKKTILSTLAVVQKERRVKNGEEGR